MEVEILGFTEISPENIDQFIEKIIKSGPEGMSELSQNYLIQILHTFNVFSKHFDDKKLWSVLEQAVLNVSQPQNFAY